jgi:hypothetical protein
MRSAGIYARTEDLKKQWHPQESLSNLHVERRHLAEFDIFDRPSEIDLDKADWPLSTREIDLYRRISSVEEPSDPLVERMKQYEQAVEAWQKVHGLEAMDFLDVIDWIERELKISEATLYAYELREYTKYYGRDEFEDYQDYIDLKDKMTLY